MVSTDAAIFKSFLSYVVGLNGSVLLCRHNRLTSNGDITGFRTFVRRPRNEEYRPMFTKKGQTRRFQHYDMGVLFVLWSRTDSLD